MEANILYSNSLFSVEVTNRSVGSEVQNADLVALIQLEGLSDIRQDGQTWILHENNYLFINPGQHFSYAILDMGMLALIRIHTGNALVRALIDPTFFEVTCHSFLDGDIGKSQMSRHLGNILHGAARADREDAALICSEFFLMLRLVCSRYCTPKKQTASGDLASLERNSRILAYLEENASRKVTLSDLANETFLSPTYLSRYIRTQFGKSFHDLLTDIRVQKAESDLLLSRVNLTKLAFDAGFPSVSAFTKAFTQRYGMSPSAYRSEKEKAAAVLQLREPAAAFSYTADIQDQLRHYMAEHDKHLTPSGMETIRIEGSTHDARIFRHFWSRMINGGLARDFLRADMQEHTRALHAELGFSYVRIWDICAPDMMLYREGEEGRYNFSRLDNVLDFLISIEVHPFIELGFKPVLLLKRADDSPLIREERIRIFPSSEEYASFLQVMLRHCAGRYGLPELETWYFEIWQDFRFTTTKEYFSEFDAIYSAIKAISPKIHVGGPGYSDETPIPLEQTLEGWKKRHLHPDFISIYSYPYERKETPGAYQSMDSAFLRKLLGQFLSCLQENGFWHQEVHISEWNLSVSNRCVLHDSLYKGAYIVRNLASMINHVDCAGYWFGSDLNSEFYDSQHLINGSAGLISKDGIRKPAFYGFEFFNRLADYLIYNDETAVVTTNLHDSYSIVCHNMRELGYQYFQKVENEVRVEDLSGFFDGESRLFHFRIHGVKNGRYQIKRRAINSHYGSVQNEWMRMGLTDNLNRMDVDYLRRICVPHITIENHEVTDGILDFSVTLEANAIENIHVYLLV